MLPPVFHYEDPRRYLRDVLAQKQRLNPLFSLRSWSRQMGFRCHSSLATLMSGKRKIRPEHFDRLNKGLRLQGDEENYLRTLLGFHAARDAREREDLANRLKVLTPAREQSLLESEKFRLVADWIHMCLLEMTRLRDFKPDPKWIARRLGFGTTERAVSEALERLLALGLLMRKGDTLEKTNQRLTTPKDKASEGIREHHRQVLNNATVALETQSVDERMYNACAITIDAARLPEAKDLIRKFREDLTKLMEVEQGNQTYQLAVQFFRLTENP